MHSMVSTFLTFVMGVRVHEVLEIRPIGCADPGQGSNFSAMHGPGGPLSRRSTGGERRTLRQLREERGRLASLSTRWMLRVRAHTPRRGARDVAISPFCARRRARRGARTSHRRGHDGHLGAGLAGVCSARALREAARSWYRPRVAGRRSGCTTSGSLARTRPKPRGSSSLRRLQQFRRRPNRSERTASNSLETFHELGPKGRVQNPLLIGRHDGFDGLVLPAKPISGLDDVHNPVGVLRQVDDCLRHSFE